MRAVEDLIADVRDPRSRVHFTEAVRAYSAGAYRSAIISTWVAVALDLMGKIRKLADDGEANAKKRVADLDTAIAHDNRQSLQKIENSLLDDARDMFELIDARDHETLKRLYRDRHVCAHPAFVAPEEAFEASPELARAHLATAVDAVLKHGATAGRKTLERFMAEAEEGRAWPGSHDTLVAYLRDRYLDRGRAGLRRNLAKVVIKGVLGIGDQFMLPARLRLADAAHAIDEIDPTLLSEALTQVVRSAEEGSTGLAPPQLMRLVADLGDLSPVWTSFPASSVPRVVTLIETADDAELINAGVMSANIKEPTIMAAVHDRLKGLLTSELSQVIASDPAPHHVEHALQALADSNTFRTAEIRMQRLVLPLAQYIEATHLDQVLEILRDNYQVNAATRIPGLLEQLFDATAARPGVLTAWQRISEFFETNTEDTSDPHDPLTAPDLRAKITTAAQARQNQFVGRRFGSDFRTLPRAVVLRLLPCPLRRIQGRRHRDRILVAPHHRDRHADHLAEHRTQAPVE